MTEPEFVTLQVEDGVGTIRLDRPKMNAINEQLHWEVRRAAQEAAKRDDVRAVVLYGGERVFAAGADIKAMSQLDGSAMVAWGRELTQSFTEVTRIPKPVIAAVNGYAIGGGHVLHVLCDMTLASDKAKFGQVGPKVGSVDPGFGTAYLTHVVGEKKAREIWFMCRQYTTQQALEMGLVNAVYPHEELMDQARAWALEIADKSPTAIKLAKQSFNCATEQFRALGNFATSALALYYETEEAVEGKNAFMEKRKPDFMKYAK